MKKHEPEKLWTAENVAEFCQVKPSKVKYWVLQREIPFIRLGRSYRFDRQEVMEWLEQRKSGAWNYADIKGLEGIL